MNAVKDRLQSVIPKKLLSLPDWFSRDQKRSDVPEGIPNIGNTCYINAVLQVLKWTPGFLSGLDTSKTDKAKQIASELSGIFACTDKKTLRSTLVSLGKSIGQNNLGSGAPGDCFEFYNSILENLHSDKEECPVKLFEGTFLITFCYGSCGHVERQVQTFTSMTVPLMDNLVLETTKQKASKEEKVGEDSKTTQELASVDTNTTQETSPIDSKPTQEPTSVDSEPTQEPTSIDSKTTQEPTSIDYKPTQEPTSIDSKPAQQPTSIDSKPAQQPTSIDSKPTQEPTSVDTNTTQKTSPIDSKTIQELTSIDSKTTKEPASVNSKTPQEPTSVASETTQEPTSIDSKTTQEPTSIDSKTTQEPTSIDSKPTQEPTSIDYKTTQEPTSINSKTTQESASVDFKTTQELSPKDSKTTVRNLSANSTATEEPIPLDFMTKEHNSNETSKTTGEIVELEAGEVRKRKVWDIERKTKEDENDNTAEYTQEITEELEDDEEKDTNDEKILNEFLKCLSIPLGNNEAVDVCSIESCLQTLVSEEQYPEGALPCRRCSSGLQASGQTTKRILIADPPPILVLHLNRVRQVVRNGMVKLEKNTELIRYPETLDISPFVSKFCAGKMNLLYQLYAVIGHHGMLGRGHYISYIRTTTPQTNQTRASGQDIASLLTKYEIDRDLQLKHIELCNQCDKETTTPSVQKVSPSEQLWFRFNDRKVTECVRPPYGDNSLNNAYMLFYNEVPT